MTSRTLVYLIAALGLVGCSDDGNAELFDAAPTVRPDSAPPTPIQPTLTSFVASPSSVSAGFATDVTWTWTYGTLPFPEPTCTIDNGVGAVTRGQTTSLTLSSIMTFTLTCTNSAGSATRPVVITVPPVAPTLASFVATPMTVPTGMAANVTWTWTYVSPPVPAPTCSISPTVGAVTNGQTTTVTQNFATFYTLTCTNTAGTRQRSMTVSVATPPVIGTFTATPSTLTNGVATNVTFAWTFSNTPTPTVTCSIDQGIGTITSGMARSLTLTATTVYTLTCSNAGGMAMQPVTITVP